MDQVPAGKEHSTESIAMRMLNVNFVALHTTTKVRARPYHPQFTLTPLSQAFTHALYHLASKPEYIPLLRAEVETFLDAQDPLSWSKEAIGRCIKLDSFLKESLRLNGLGAIWMPRLTLGDFTFSDGTTIPAGNFVATAVTAIHEDDANYPRAKEFDGLRFSNAMQGASAAEDADAMDGDGHWMHRLTGTSPSYLTFGGGRHIWSVLVLLPQLGDTDRGIVQVDFLHPWR
jgi:hypothetical protein